jgi:hypothetical protein
MRLAWTKGRVILICEGNFNSQSKYIVKPMTCKIVPPLSSFDNPYPATLNLTKFFTSINNGGAGMNIIDTMKKFLEPESIAIVGATRKTGEFSMNIMGHLLSNGYKGRMYPVTPILPRYWASSPMQTSKTCPKQPTWP